MTVPRIAVVGSINMDLVMRCAQFPRPGETVVGETFTTSPGGKGANQAVAAARLDASVSMIGCVGRDAYGAQMRAILQNEKINIDNILQRGGVSTGMAMILVNTLTGENCIIINAGANGEFFARDILAPSAAETIESADVLLLQLEVPNDVNRQAAQIARKAGVTVILNAAPATKVAQPLLSLVDILIVNEIESQTISGLSTADPSVTHHILANHLRSLTGGHICITLGSNGALYHDGATVHAQDALPVETVIDTTAAGDAFVGAFGVAWAEAKDGPECLRFACATGALAVTKPGAMQSLPTRAEVDAFCRAQ